MSSTTIRDVETIVYQLPFVRPHKLAMTTITEQAIVLVRITSENGTVGVGQSSVLGGFPYSEETPVGMRHLIVNGLSPQLVGQDVTRRGELVQKMNRAVVGNRYAKAAVEMALLDLHARVRDVNAAELLGGQVHDSFRLMWVLGTGDADSDIAEAEMKLDQRLHDLFLVKIGRGAPSDDVARVAKVANALGGRAELRVDINQAWSERQAAWACRELASVGVTVVEQPVARARHDALRRLTRLGLVTVMADESVVTAEDAIELARDRSIDAFSLKIVKHGGISETLRVAAIAQAAGIELFGGGMIEPTIEIAASLLTFSALPALELDCQLFGPTLYADDITIAKPEMHDFRVWVPTGPGLDVTVDPDKLAHYRVDA